MKQPFNRLLSLLFIAVFLFTSFIAQAQSYSNVYGRYGYTDSVKFLKLKNNSALDYFLSTDTTGRLIFKSVAIPPATDSSVFTTRNKARTDSATFMQAITNSLVWTKNGADASLAGSASFQGATLNAGGTAFLTAAYLDTYGGAYSLYTHGGNPINIDPKDNGEINLKNGGLVRLKVQASGDIAISQNATITKVLNITGDESSKVNIGNNKSGINEIMSIYNGNTASGFQGSSLLLSGYYKSAVISAYGSPQAWTGGVLQLQTYKDNSTKNNGIYMNNVGFVGVNNLAPIVALDVIGEGRFTGEVTVKDAIMSTSAVTKHQLDAVAASANSLTAVYPVMVNEGLISLGGGSVTKAQRNALLNPAVGLLVWQTDYNVGFHMWNGTNWMQFAQTID